MPRPYAELSQDEEKLLHNNDLSESSSALGLHDSQRSSLMGKIIQHSYLLHWLAHSVTIVLLLVLLGEQRRDAPRKQELYSPAYGIAPPPLHYEVFKTAFWQKTPYKAYPNEPTKETIDAWEHITMTPALNLTADELSQMGLSTDSVQWPESAGGGYIGYLESAHQLHCLQSIWERHHYDKDPTNPLYANSHAKIQEMPDIEEAHLEHCVDVIRQRLMCTADASIVTFRWVKGLSTPYPNFHTGHMCANYEGLLGWAEERKADMSKVDGWDYHFKEGETLGTQIDYLP